MDVKTLVRKFGGQSILAAKLGIGQSAIAYWVKKNAIPTKWHQNLLSIANQESVEISANDLISVQRGNINEREPSTSLEQPSHLNRLDFYDRSSDQFMFYASEKGVTKVQVLLGDETVWATQRGMAEIFDTTRENITIHLKNIFESNELSEISVCKETLLPADDGKEYITKLYNLDTIISVGYRVNSYKATQFRKWATTILKEYLIKGFALDDERLKQGNQLFGQDYFDELLERIRKIRTSERMLWEKVTDLYSQCSYDYDPQSDVTRNFFAQVQNKFHYAITHHTAAEIVKIRANSNKPNMGLTSYKNINKDQVILKSDVSIAKNYLQPEELDELERLVENYLGTAELFAKRKIIMTMKDWVNKLDEFLRFNSYDVLSDFGKVRADVAKKHALHEYEKYIKTHEREFKSDFNRFIEQAKFRKKS